MTSPAVRADLDAAPLVLTVYGEPATQGSLRAIAPRPGARPVIVNDNRAKLRAWRGAIVAAVKSARPDGPVLVGPVSVSLAFFLPPLACTPRDGRTWPVADLDKLTRAALDAFTVAGLYRDDSQVTGSRAWKAYAGARVDGLAVPGMVARIVPGDW